jgi:hypothetical protein
MNGVHTLDVVGCYHNLGHIQNYVKGRAIDPKKKSVVELSVDLRHNKIHVALNLPRLSVSKSAKEADVELPFWKIDIHGTRSDIIAPL